jgi:ribosome-associated toxin RatA of RatAB toxin-antitoxin module
MPTAQEHQTVHEIDVAAPADVVHGIIADPTRWPRYFTPTVHVDRSELDAGTERLRIWATGNGVLRSWSSIRTIEEDRHFISFRQEVSAPPVKFMAGTWAAKPGADGGVRLVLTHHFQAIDDDPASVAWIAEATNKNSDLELANIKRLAENWDQLGELEFSFEDSVRMRAKPADVYAFLHDAALWPDRLPHVASLELKEEGDGELQLMAMRTRAKDGSTHLTESARVCFPDEAIYYKQTVTPALMTAHTGSWLIEPADDGDGVLVRAGHSIVLSETGLGTVPAAGTTWESTRAFVRASIGGNSRATLLCCKEFAEAR